MIVPLNLPRVASLRLTKKDDVVYVWCIIRKKELVCTPEEWVRQHVIHFLINEQNIPEGLIASEYPLEYNGLKKRADIVVFNRQQQPTFIVECKATKVELTESVLYQVAQYNSQLNVPHFMITNGVEHFYGSIKNGINYSKDFPELVL